MQYKNPQVVGLVAHLLIKVVSLPATVKHWLLSLPFVGSYKRFNGYVGTLPAVVVVPEPLSPSVGSIATQVRPAAQP